jgi:predicted metal-dependent hydrolase
MMKDFIRFGSKRIDFHLQYADRKTLGISVSPEMEVLVKAPIGSSIEKIKSMLHKKAPWILKQQNFFLGFHPKTPARGYVSGETHLYMGRQYKLKVIKTTKNAVHFTGREILVYTKQRSKAKDVLSEWYRERAKMKFAEIAEPIIQKFKKYKVEPKSIYLQDMPTRWGSCTIKRKIILNPELIKAPKACIEYVIVHELCHLVYKNHSQKFFDLQKKEMPDWEKWKNKLEMLLA